MLKEGTVVADEDGKLYVVVKITKEVVLCSRYLGYVNPAVYVFNSSQLQEIQREYHV